ncbi:MULTISPECIES: sensor histidine kinase [unclassified Rothia (in: high G+C Gram-positive bacteria)]|uniref:sensor histidine kinase n=1 Tax=unclassified Rothia (in: high G+C Gram-positive bacteria) TaxID=2689056 RepID=UPI001EF6E654|nr:MULTISPECIES: PAS domain-containing sensor histidine kinase [unclassified Rothia (in: high G+C Gram-positive bacteria)]
MHIDPFLQNAEYGPGDMEWLHLLIGDWQIIADTAHGDLVLWLPTDFNSDILAGGRYPTEPGQESGFIACAHMRPSTVHTLFYTDLIDHRMKKEMRLKALGVWKNQCSEKYVDSETVAGLDIQTTLVPLTRNGRTLGLLSVHSETYTPRQRTHVELVYRELSEELLKMTSRGIWPEFSAPVGTTRGAPRVSDGLMVLDAEGVITFTSPNATSIYKKLGFSAELEGQSLAHITRALLPQGEQVDETLPLVLAGKMPWRAEIKAHFASITYRAIPLRRFTPLGEERFGAIILCRDVTELRRRELELMTKDATIREIHHRVKNNLQTVSALLRLQARRMESDEARQGLEQAMRRVATIATVHEALSQGLAQNVDFDDLIGRQFHLAAELASPGQDVRTELTGSFGSLPSKFATPLALVINEIVANAVEHGLAGETGTVTMDAQRAYDERAQHTLTVSISDDGRGMNETATEPKTRDGLGTQIVKTLVASELNGSITWKNRSPRGTTVEIEAVLGESR